MRLNVQERRVARSAAETEEIAERRWQCGCKRHKIVRHAGIKSSGCRRAGIRERCQRGHCLADARPFQRAFVAIIVGWINRLGRSECAGDHFDGTAVLGRDSGGKHTGQRPMITLDAHDPRSRHAQIAGAKVTNADKVSGDKGILEGDQRIQGHLCARKHALGIEKLRERCLFPRYGSLQEVMRHLFLSRGFEVVLVIRSESGEEGGLVDDVRVGGYREGFGDFGGNQDFAVAGP